MKLVIFGAGYVGTVTGACLAKQGHQVVFIEPNPEKVREINAGKSPVHEPGLNELIREGRESLQIGAKPLVEDDLEDAEVALIAVATPSHPNGSLRTDQLEEVLNTISMSVKERELPLIVAIRSTVHPSALKRLLSGFQNSNISIVIHPEFLRESSAVKDFFNAPFCVAGGDDENAVHKVLDLYQGMSGKKWAVDRNTASLLKYACNAFHALKIAFANEVGSICEALSVDPSKLMDLFCKDEHLNCSRAYLKPGFSFGGSCLPKDLKALLSLGRELETQLPLISAILPSNHLRFQNLASEVIYEGHKEVAVIGMSFKKNTDDLRDSPYVELIEFLIGKGVQVRIYDPDIHPSQLKGANLQVFYNSKNHLAEYLKTSLVESLDGCDAIIYCKDLCRDDVIMKVKQCRVALYDLNYLLPKHVSQKKALDETLYL